MVQLIVSQSPCSKAAKMFKKSAILISNATRFHPAFLVLQSTWLRILQNLIVNLIFWYSAIPHLSGERLGSGRTRSIRPAKIPKIWTGDFCWMESAPGLGAGPLGRGPAFSKTVCILLRSKTLVVVIENVYIENTVQTGDTSLSTLVWNIRDKQISGILPNLVSSAPKREKLGVLGRRLRFAVWTQGASTSSHSYLYCVCFLFLWRPFYIFNTRSPSARSGTEISENAGSS